MVRNHVRLRRVSKRSPVRCGWFRHSFPSAADPDAATVAGEAPIYKDAAAGQESSGVGGIQGHGGGGTGDGVGDWRGG